MNPRKYNFAINDPFDMDAAFTKDYMLESNIAFAMYLKKGDNIIEMRFNPSPYSIGNKVVIASNFILLLLSISILFLEVRTKFKK